jgi:hypothetical protein
MTRLLLLVLIAWLVWQGIERLLDRLRLAAGATRREPTRPERGGRSERAGRSDNVETLVRCAGCGVHVSRSHTLTVPGGALVCSEECRRRTMQSA